jgi:uroporphyrinogen decarboxylase
MAQISGKQIYKYLEKGLIPPRIPFCPTIFEHAARIINITPSQLAKSVDFIVDGQMAAYELYGHDLISVAVDIYNVQAEAVGSEVVFWNDNSVPSIKENLINDESDLKNLTIPNPEKDGRMPVFLEACEILDSKVGDQVNVSGNIVGPFTLAAILRGYENFIMDLVTNERFAFELLKFSMEVGIVYANAFIKRGLGVAISESWIAPPLLSPKIYRDKILKFHKEIIINLKKSGLKNVALISGGDTYSIASDLIQTGSSILVADANTNQREFKVLCDDRGIVLRGNIASKMVEEGDQLEMEGAVKTLIDNCASNGRFIFGCGVVSYDTPPENLIALRRMIEKHNPYQIMQ